MSSRGRGFAISWSTEDRLLFKLLFEPEKARALILNRAPEITLPEHDFDWQKLVQKAQQEGVAGVLFHNMQKHRLDDLFPEKHYRFLSYQYYNNLKRNMSTIAELRVVLAKFQEAGVLSMVLKGIALAEHIYPGIGMRGMSDVDLMIKKSDIIKVDDCLSSLGYVSRDSSVLKALNNPEGYLASIEYRRDDAASLNLHVHWHTVNTSVPATAFIGHIDIGRIWEKSVTARVADSYARMLCPEHLIIYLCEHALRVGHSFDRLILICDIFFAIKFYENNIDWNFIVEESNRFHLCRFVYYSLSIVEYFTLLNIPDDFLQQLKPDKISRGEKLFLDLQMKNNRIRGSSYFIYLSMNRGFLKKIKFIARTIFPPQEILLQRRYGRDAEFTKKYYLFRIWEVITHIFRIFSRRRKKIAILTF